MNSGKTVISVKVPILWDSMSVYEQDRLTRITGRDTRVIRAFLGVIARHEKELIVGKRKKKINGGKLEKLTLTAERSKDGSKNRLYVPHDFKKRFRNISLNELQECRQVAVAMWNSYLALEGEQPLKAKGYRSRKLPRYVFDRRFKLLYEPEQEFKHILEIMDSLDSAKTDGWFHDRLRIPLSPSSYHLNRMSEGKVTSLRIFKDARKKWWGVFSVRITVPVIAGAGKPLAVMGIDLGIDKAVCSVVLTKERVRFAKYFTQHEKVKRIKRYDEMVDSLQREMDTKLNNGQPADDVILRLRELSGRRLNISKDHDGVLVKQLTDHILELSKKYDLYVAIGKLTGIRDRAGKMSGKRKSFRKLVARWSFARVSNALKHSLAQHGWKVSGRNSRFIPVREFWTSVTCHKCGHRGIRPKQSLFICHTCGYRSNADKNGAINIARRLITLIPSLRDEKGLGRWLFTPKGEGSTLKVWRSSRSKGKSSRSQSISGSKGPSAAECRTQTSLEEYDDATDPAVVRTVEIPSAVIHAREGAEAECSAVQRTEATSELASDKARVHESGVVLTLIGDECRENGGTRELRVTEKVHSPSSET
ncbi:MAG: RNA-guided endonuclease InsQ/TnpB family protein [Candidatus Thorarchaeota archaeon]|jgi:IS605 OrfB family transposase